MTNKKGCFVPHDLTDDHTEIGPLRILPISSDTLFWEEHIARVVQPYTYYKFQELVTLTVQHISPIALSAGFGRLGHRATLGRILEELHGQGRVRRFIEGIYKQSGDPYGVLWMIQWN